MKSHQDDKKEHHHHDHQQTGQRPHPLSHFFGCCLGDEPAPLSQKIISLRENLNYNQFDEVHLAPGQTIEITKDMIVGDILLNFPATQPLLQDLHPLGMMSPALNSISLEIFLSDLPVNPDSVCQQLTSIINQPLSSDA